MTAPPTARAASVGELAELWPAVVQRLQAGGDALLAGYVNDGRPVELSDDTLAIGFPQTAGLSMRKVTSPACREQLATAVREVTGLRLRIDAVLRDDAAGSREAAVLSEEEFIRRVKDEFDAQELPPEPEPKEA